MNHPNSRTYSLELARVPLSKCKDKFQANSTLFRMKAVMENGINTAKEELLYASNNNNNNNNSVVRTVCSCSCHCSLTTQHSDSPSPATSDEDVSQGELVTPRRRRSRRARLNRSLCTSGPHHAKHRHYSADHVRCIRQVELRAYCRRNSIKDVKCRSSELGNLNCDLCGCTTTSSSCPSSASFTRNGDEKCFVPPFNVEFYDKKRGKLLEPLAATTDPLNSRFLVPPIGSIRQSCSDPKLSTSDQSSLYQHPSAFKNDDPISKGFFTLNRKSKKQKHISDLHPSLASKITPGDTKKYNSLSRLNRRNLSFRITPFRKLSIRKLNPTPSSDSICPPPGNVQLSAINKLNNEKSLAELKEQMDVSFVHPTRKNSLDSSNSFTARQWGNKMFDGNIMTASLRRKKRSFLEKYGSVSSGGRVQPVSATILETHQSDHISVNGATRAWHEEYDADYDHLHHVKCPCRSSMRGPNKVNIIVVP